MGIEDDGGMRVGIFDHFGWAVSVTASDDHEVVDRRRVELIERGTAAAPIHTDGKGMDLAAVTALVAEVRESATRVTSAALDALAAAVPAPITSISLRAVPGDFPSDIAVQRRTPYEARADAIMYRQVLAEVARARGWELHEYVAKHVLDQAADVLGERAGDVLAGVRARLGPPWTKDHQLALAATVVASAGR
jgi:hypothetical protein